MDEDDPKARRKAYQREFMRAKRAKEKQDGYRKNPPLASVKTTVASEELFAFDSEAQWRAILNKGLQTLLAAEKLSPKDALEMVKVGTLMLARLESERIAREDRSGGGLELSAIFLNSNCMQKAMELVELVRQEGIGNE